MTVFVKIAGNNLPTIQIVFIRGLITLFFTFIVIRRKNIYLWGSNHSLLIMRGFFGTFALFFVYESIQRFTLFEATVIQYLFPIFTAIFASIIISENIGFKLVFSILLGLVGVFIILSFPFINQAKNYNMTSTLIAIVGALLTGFSYVLVRLSSIRGESPYVIMFYFPLFTVPLSFPFSYYSWVNPSLEMWIILLFLGLSTQLGQTFLTHGYKLLPASKAAPVSYIQVPLSVIFGSIIFAEQVSYNFIVGSIIIFFAILIIMQSRDET
tara:strand:- start:3926 stop:4729 length:804 start_codon:yes stop_codon:yes gene_type:complete